METIDFQGVSIPILTIPKNTLLFRAVNHVEADYAGQDVAGKLCIPPNYNVYFYYTPFAVDSVKWYDSILRIEVCITTKDIKVVSLINPSQFTRSESRYNSNFLVPCNSDALKKACFKSKHTDPCFVDAFLEQFPDIVGYTSVSKEDSIALATAMRGKLKPYAKYIPLVDDAKKVKGTPEIVLYPLTKRHTDSIWIEHPESFKGNQSYNYKHIASLNRNCDDREKFMKEHAVFSDGRYSYKA